MCAVFATEVAGCQGRAHQLPIILLVGVFWVRYREIVVVEVELRAPAILIAVPQLGDPNFQRAVVLMVEHSDEGSMGLVINRPTDLEIGSFCDSQGMPFGGDGGQPVFVGGPVQTERAFLLHSPGLEGPETEIVMDGVNLSYSLDSLQMLTATPPSNFRVYLGYAGWGPDQLATEIAEGAWLVGESSSELVFISDVEQAWEVALREMGIEPVQLMHSGAIH